MVLAEKLFTIYRLNENGSGVLGIIENKLPILTIKIGNQKLLGILYRSFFDYAE